MPISRFPFFYQPNYYNRTQFYNRGYYNPSFTSKNSGEIGNYSYGEKKNVYKNESLKDAKKIQSNLFLEEDFLQKNNSKSSSKQESYFFELFGLKLYFDDILLICLIFFLYEEGVKDDELFISLILLLLS